MKIGVFVLVALSFVGAANASQDTSDVNAFEKKYIKCMSDDLHDSCMEQVLSSHLDPLFANDKKVAVQVQDFLSHWKGSNSVYKVHVVAPRLIGDIFDIRSYLIELSNGQMAGLRLSFRKKLGKWYIFDMQGAATDSFIKDLVEMPSLSPEK